MAENSGSLSWEELAQVHFKSQLAEKFNLGPFNVANGGLSRKKSRMASKIEEHLSIAEDRSRGSSSSGSISNINSSNNMNSGLAMSMNNPFVRLLSFDINRDDIIAAIEVTAPNATTKLAAKKRSFS